MEKFEKNTSFLNGGASEREGEWKTINGAHVFIENGQSIEDALKNNATNIKFLDLSKFETSGEDEERDEEGFNEMDINLLDLTRQSSLSDNEERGLQVYKDSGIVNSYFWGEDENKIDEIVELMITRSYIDSDDEEEEKYNALNRLRQDIRNAINKGELTKNYKLFRGASSIALAGQLIEPGEHISLGKGFISTSISKNVADRHASDLDIEIFAEKGSRGVTVYDEAQDYNNEYEVLLPDNAKFTVIEYNKKAGKLKLLYEKRMVS